MIVSVIKVVVAVMVGSILLGCQPGILKPSNITSTPKVVTPSKQVTLNTLPLKEKWRWSGIINKIAITKNFIVIVEGVGFEQSIHAFDIHTGHSLWANKTRVFNIGTIRSVSADENRIYIGTITDVQAFDLETGKRRLWQGAVQPSLSRGGFRVFPHEDQVDAYHILEPDLYILNATTGETMQKITNPNLFYRWNNEVDYLLDKSHHYLEAQDILTGKKFWGQQFSGIIVNASPIFFDNTIVLNIAHKFIGLVGVDVNSGNIIWETSDEFRLLNVAALDNLIYALRYDAAIVGLDAKTGEQVGIIQMTPNHTEEDDGGILTYYSIITSDKYLVVYYGNSQELIIFEKVGGLDTNTQ